MKFEGRLESWYLRTKAGKQFEDEIRSLAITENNAKRLAIHDEHLARAKRFRAQGRSTEALTRFRRAVLAHPGRAQTWIDYGFEAIKAHRSSLAHEAFSNALELDPSNPIALEMSVDLNAKLGLPAHEIRRLTNKAADAILGRPQRQLDIIEIAYPHGLGAFHERIDRYADPKAKALLYLAKDPQHATTEPDPSLDATESRDVLVRFYLLQGRYSQADKVLSRIPADQLPVSTLRRVAKRQSQLGRHRNALLATKHLLRANRDDAWARARYAASEREFRNSEAASEKRWLLESGFPFPSVGAPARDVDATSILYLLHNSLPFSSAGYATRSHGLISNISRQGYRIAGVTRPGYPFDRPEATYQGASIASPTHVDGTPYYHLSIASEKLAKHPLVPYVEEYAARVERLARERRSSLIHAASNHWNGLAAVTAANRLGIPSIYEVRGLWEVTRISREPEWQGSLEYTFMAKMEAEAAFNATHVLAITGALRQEMVNRGVPAEKIDVVPNGVDTQRFVPRAINSELKRRLGISEPVVIGYVGSILDYEGIDTLIDAAGLLSASYDSFHVLIVGDGDYFENARSRTSAAGLDHIITFTGRVPHDEVEDYYSIIDIAPLPRHALPVTEMVSPLKPFEAMAMGKAVVGSDVDAIKEIIVEGVNGVTFTKDDPRSLAAALSGLLEHPDRIRSIGSSARQWVEEERDWRHIATRVTEIYKRLLGV